jgi:hypothetical protein
VFLEFLGAVIGVEGEVHVVAWIPVRWYGEHSRWD